MKTPKAKRAFVRHDPPARLASDSDEHGRSVEGDEERCVPGLTQAEKATTTALIDATILDIRDAVFYLRKVNARKSGYSVVALGEAIAQELDLDFGTNLALDG